MLLVVSNSQTRRSLLNFNFKVKISESSKLLSVFRGAMERLSDLARIDVKAADPFLLFREWQQEARTFSTGMPGAFCLATVSSDGKPNARHLVLRRLDDDGFDLMTDRRSQKVEDLSRVQSAAMCFLWAYKNDNGESVSRQVRIEGCVKELKKEECQKLYEGEPLYCKIRSHVCNQGTKVDWKELKASHDELLEKVEKGEADLPMPDHVIGYKLAPLSMEFYYSRDHLIADRVLFYKDSTTGDWGHHHLAA